VADLLIDDVQVAGRAGISVLVRDGRIAAVGERAVVSRQSGARGARLDGRGAALLPGLHDHHIHLLAAAARASSRWCGAPEVTDRGALVDRLRAAASAPPDERHRSGGQPTGRWVRAVGWDDAVAGWPDRVVLDAASVDRPIRLQHRSGAMWVLNSAGLAAVGLDGPGPHPTGVEVDAGGTPTGRLTGLDGWLRQRIGGAAPSLADLSAELSARGVSGVTDATAHNGPAELVALGRARQRGELAPRLVAMTSSAGVEVPDGVEVGPVKVRVDESALPSLEQLAGRMGDAHRANRAVAVHAASRVALVVAVEALKLAGAVDGDRIEHASVAPPELLGPIARAGATVVTQPHFLAERGDRYLESVDRRDQPWLYRCRGLLDAGIPLAAGSDAPVGRADPWRIMAAAVQRTTASGVVVNPAEALTPEQALALFTGHPTRPGGPPRRVEPGAPADLCLLDRAWAEARRDLAAVQVAATIVDGAVTWWA
jgi:predicted amidohydrolase YtcJ